MKCPKCGAEVAKGSLFCHKCLAEVPWVKEYRTVETLFQQHNAARKSEEIADEEEEKTTGIGFLDSLRSWILILGKKKSIFLVVVLLTAMAAAGIGIHHYRSFSHQYTLAIRDYSQGRYRSSDRHLERALRKCPNDLYANLQVAKNLEAQGDAKSAEMVLKTLLKSFPHEKEVYREYLKVLEGRGKTDTIREVLTACEDPEILDACSDYLCPDPSFSLEEGTYTKPQMLYIHSSCDRIYYTIDGTTPTQNSLKYEDGISIGEGSTQVSVFCVNSRNVPSNIVTKKYVVFMKSPDAPVVTPEEQIFHKKTKIVMEVPEGCTGYYAFDQEPTALSTVYKGPVPMPEGTHTFYGLLIGANNKQSELTVRTYTVIYD